MRYISTFLVCVLVFASCKAKLYSDQIDRNKFCQYFQIKTDTIVIDGKKRIGLHIEIIKIKKDKVSAFIQSHPLRFDYLINNVFTSILSRKTNDSASKKVKFCRVISSDSFYNQFCLLTNGERNTNKKITYSVPEIMKIASRFFMCDTVRAKDTQIGYHICVGINGVSELKTSIDPTVPAAFCFEAIFTNLKKKAAFIENFNNYIKRSSEQNRKVFTSFQDHLIKVRNDCYAAMENDGELKKIILNHYRTNKDNIFFRIE